jgi:small subunit ribosomal protein S3
MRVGVIKDWDSRWYARPDKVGDLIVEDYKIRNYLKKTLYSAGVPTIEIERDSAKVRIFIHCSRPGVVIGKGGAEIERIRLEVEKMIGKPVALSIVEVRTPDTNAQLVAENIAAQLEKRIGFRRAMKNSIGRAMRMGAKGIKIQCSGRLGGAEIARTETYHEGTIPLQTIRADIDYGFAEAATTYGRIGVKVWIYKGEILTTSLRTTPRVMAGMTAVVAAVVAVVATTVITTIARVATTVTIVRVVATTAITARAATTAAVRAVSVPLPPLLRKEATHNADAQTCEISSCPAWPYAWQGYPRQLPGLWRLRHCGY